MPSTYTLISSNVLSSSAASVTFSAIPSTYTDLVLRWSARSDNTASLRFVLNNDTTANYSRTRLIGSNSVASSTQNTALANWSVLDGAAASTYTANTFTSGEIYIPNYAGSANKVGAIFNAAENNSTSVGSISVDAQLRSATAAITEIKTENAAGNFVSGSSFYLYGIKNS